MSVKLLFLIGLAIPVFYFDIRYRKIPNWLTLGSWISYAVYLSVRDSRLPLPFLFASLIAVLSYVLLYIITRKKLGMGDVKLSLILGGINGLSGWYFTNLFASVWGLVIFLLLMLLKKVDFKSKIPFGPFLCTGGIANQILTGTGIL